MSYEEKLPTPQPSEVAASQEDLQAELIGTKFESSWAAARRELGTANVHRTLQNFYASLYTPEVFANSAESEIFRGLPALAEPLAEQPQVIPSEDEFFDTMKRSLVRDVDHHEALYDPELIGMRELMKRGRVTIWTSGDHTGFPERGAPGSYYQFSKIASAGLGKVRREVAAELGQPRSSTLKIEAADEKFDHFEETLRVRKERGVTRLVILEDQVKNLIKAEKIAPEMGIDILPIWVRQGQHGNKLSEGMSEDEASTHYNSVSSVDESLGVIDKVIDEDGPGAKTEFLVDYDGVVADDVKRYELQRQGIVFRLREQGWI